MKFSPMKMITEQPANGRRYRQGQDLAGKATKTPNPPLDRFPANAGRCPHLFGARGVKRFSQV